MNAFKISGILLAISLLASAGAAADKEPTALQLIREGNRFVGEQAKDKVLKIESEKSVAGLVPNVWRITYYDSTAAMKATEVKFGAGRMLDVTRPLFRNPHATPLQLDQLKVDSDEALRIASKEPMLEKLKLVASELELERSKFGQPIWRVRFWAQKLREPSKTANLGDIFLGADDGKIVKTDLNLKRVD